MFELEKQQEMKEMLGRYADGQVEMLQRAMDDWDRVSARGAAEPPSVEKRGAEQRALRAGEIGLAVVAASPRASALVLGVDPSALALA